MASDSRVDQHLCNDESGVYHVPATAAVRRKSTISYGTQRDRVRWLVEELALPHAGAVPCHQLYEKPGPTTRVLRHALEVGAVYHRSGESNLNVMGFSQSYPGEDPSESSVLTALCGNKPHFALILLETHGWLILRPSPLRPCFDTFRVPLVRMPENKYYVVALAGVAAVDPATARAARAGARRSTPSSIPVPT